MIMSNNLQNLIKITRVKYEKIGRIWCPLLDDYVYFTSEGRVHLIYKGNRKKRPVQEQFYKLNLFPLVVPVIKKSTQIKSIRSSPKNKIIQFYAIVGKAGKNNVKIRVIIKKTGSGQFNYHSVMIDNK